MVLLWLYLLATTDAMFCGYRAAAGRNALINKTAYYHRAMWRGAIFGQAAVVILGIATGIVIVSASDRAVMKATLFQAGERMLVVYLPYAAVTLTAFVTRWIPSVDVRSSVSALICGPLTFIRPLIATAGVAWAMIVTRRAEIIGLGMLALALMLSMERALGWSRALWKSAALVTEDFEAKTAACCGP